MLDRYKKLVAVAEDMATELSQHGDVTSMEIFMGSKHSYVEIGLFCEVGGTYYPDENVVMPDYGVMYRRTNYIWLEDTQEWETEAQMRLEAEISAYEDTMPDLPF
jgi:hypothetical protein